MDGFDVFFVPDDDEALPGALPHVDALVDGRSVRFLLDTGAGRTCLRADEWLAALPATGGDGPAGIFGQSLKEETIVLPRLALGPIVRTDLPVTRVAAASPAAGNLIGMDLLVRHRCHFLFDRARVLIDPPAPDEMAWQPLDLDAADHPHLDIVFPVGVARAAWDTGASATVVDLGFVARHPAWFREVGRSRGTDATGATMETPTLLMSGATIGGHPFPPHRVAGVDFAPINARLATPMDLILGYGTQRWANWLMDFPGRRWALTMHPTEV